MTDRFFKDAPQEKGPKHYKGYQFNLRIHFKNNLSFFQGSL